MKQSIFVQTYDFFSYYGYSNTKNVYRNLKKNDIKIKKYKINKIYKIEL